MKVPVYFVRETPDILDYHSYIENDKSSQADSSAAQALLDSIFSDGFQFVVNAGQSRQLTPNEYQPLNIQGKLNGGAIDESKAPGSRKIPTVLVVAHYDAFGLATV